MYLMTPPGDSNPVERGAETGRPEDQAESELIAQEYEEEASMAGGPVDVEELVVRVRKIEERLATIEDYLGTPPSTTSLEERLRQLESEM
jgi:hypothetical protein